MPYNAEQSFMVDNYMTFFWNGKHSYNDFGVFITNDAEDLRFVNAPNFSNTFVSPLFQNTRYYMGTSIEGRTITLNLAVQLVTLSDYRKIITWLNVYDSGLLILNYDVNYGYYVKIKTIGDGVKRPQQKRNLQTDPLLPPIWGEMQYLVTFEITFETVSEPEAVSRYRTIVPVVEYIGVVDNVNQHSRPVVNPTGDPVVDISIFGPLTDTEEVAMTLEKSWVSGEGLIGTSYWADIQIHNYGTISTPIQLDVSNFIGTITLELINSENYNALIDLKQDIRLVTGSETWLCMTVDSLTHEVLGFNYDSETGSVIVNGELIETIVLQGDNILQYKMALSNKYINPHEAGEYTILRLIWTSELDCVLSFNKKTQII